GIGALVNSFRIFLVVHRPVHQELTFGTVAPANVLKHEDVAVFYEFVVTAIDAVRGETANSVGCSAHQYRQRFSLILWREDQCVQTHAVARWNHLFALFKGHEFLDRGLIAYLPCLIVNAVLTPDNARNFALRVANKSCRRFDDTEKEFRIALREDLDPALVRRLQIKLFALAPEREHEFGIVNETVLTDVLVKKFWVDLDFGVL